MRALTAFILMASCMPVLAGGTAFACRYESLTDDGHGNFVLKLVALDTPDVLVEFADGRHLFLHLQYSSRDPLPSGHKPVTRQDFDAALARIRSDLKAGSVTRFGVLGAALRRIKGNPGHYKIYGLRLEDEADPEKPGAPLVVYAY